MITTNMQKSLLDLSQKHTKCAPKSKQVLLVPSSFLLHLIFIYYYAPEPGKKNSQAAFTGHVILYHLFPHSPSLSLLYHHHHFWRTHSQLLSEP